ncbi:MAG TPA: hypothetical protein VMU64_00300 [Acidimicrobiales bacterium]|nr:hypothetical protein [Acidimicrobiales bacterium]
MTRVAHDLPVSDLDSLKDGMVKPSPRLGRGPCVCLGAIGGEAHGDLQDLLPFRKVGVGQRKTLLGRSDVGTDPGLLGLEHRDVDGSAVVGIEQLAPLSLCLRQLAGQEIALRRVAALTRGDLDLQLVAHGGEPVLR